MMLWGVRKINAYQQHCGGGILSVAFVLAIWITLLSPVSAATFEKVSGSSIGCSLKITGLIEEGDADRLKEHLGDVWQPEGRVCFDSPGGSFVEGIRMAEVMRGGTGVDEGDLCESACFIAFMAGSFNRMEDRTPVTDRVMHPGARVGFHSPSLAIKTGQYSEFEVSKAYALALLSIAELVRLREDRPTYIFRDMLLDQMLRVPPDTMRFIETVGDAAFFDITVYPVELPQNFSEQHAAQACKALGRISDDFEMTDEYLDGKFKWHQSDAELIFTAAFNVGESGSECRIVYRFDESDAQRTPDLEFEPQWQVATATVTDWYIDPNDFEVSAYLHYPFDARIVTLATLANAHNRNLDLLKTLKVEPTKRLLSCWLTSGSTRIANVDESANLRSAPDFSASVVRQVPLSEAIGLLRPDQLKVIGAARYQQTCVNACQALRNDGNDDVARDVAKQCINDNVLWYQITDAGGNRGWMSRKYLEEQN